MHRFLFEFVLFFCLFSACQTDSTGPVPVDTTELVPLLVELQLAESLSTEIPVQLRDSMRLVYISRVLEDHQTSQAQLDSLLWIVRSEPVWIVEVFTAVSDSLAIRELGKPEEASVVEDKED